MIVGSAFDGADGLPDLELEAETLVTPWGAATVLRPTGLKRPAYLLFRHGRPHRWLPHQIPYRAHAWALRELGCGALLVTSSVGVLDAELPLYKPLLVADLLTLDNRLPDGSVCSMFQIPNAEQGHLVLEEGLFSAKLGEQLRIMAAKVGEPLAGEVVFGYAGGPRTKTRAENRMWSRLGAQVNSMTLAPEVILANELGISCVGLAIGHKYSLAESATSDTGDEIAESLLQARRAGEKLVVEFLRSAKPVASANRIHGFSGPRS